MHEAGNAEVSRVEGNGDGVQVPQNLRSARAVGAVALKLDAAPVGSRLEEMGRGVLIDSHCHAATTLHALELAVGIGTG